MQEQTCVIYFSLTFYWVIGGIISSFINYISLQVYIYSILGKASSTCTGEVQNSPGQSGPSTGQVPQTTQVPEIAERSPFSLSAKACRIGSATLYGEHAPFWSQKSNQIPSHQRKGSSASRRKMTRGWLLIGTRPTSSLVSDTRIIFTNKATFS